MICRKLSSGMSSETSSKTGTCQKIQSWKSSPDHKQKVKVKVKLCNGDVFSSQFFTIKKYSNWICMNCWTDYQHWNRTNCAQCGKDQSFSVMVFSASFKPVRIHRQFYDRKM